MHIVRPQIDVKRLLGLHRFLDKRNRFIDKTLSNPRALHPAHALAQPLGRAPDAPGLVRILPGPQRQRQQLRPHTLEVGKRGVKAVLGNRGRVVHIALAAHVPFAEMPRGITGLLQRPRQHRRPGIQPLRHAPPLIHRAMGQVRGDAPALRILPRGNRRTRRRANRRVHIKLLKPHTLLRQPINVRRLRGLVPKTRKVPPPHVIDKHENDIWRRGRKRGVQEQRKAKGDQRLHVVSVVTYRNGRTSFSHLAKSAFNRATSFGRLARRSFFSPMSLVMS